MLLGLTQVFSAAPPAGVTEVAFAQYDNLLFAINVPEPGSLELFSFGILGLGLALRRRRSR